MTRYRRWGFWLWLLRLEFRGPLLVFVCISGRCGLDLWGWARKRSAAGAKAPNEHLSTWLRSVFWMRSIRGIVRGV